MKKLIILLFILSVIQPNQVRAQNRNLPPSATEIVNSGIKKANASGKNLMVIFHASWCGWCHKMDTALNDPDVKALFGQNFVIKHLVVDESKENQHLENPGADSLLKQYAPNGSGIPFWVIYDGQGKLLSTSFMPNGKNSGCPASKAEVDFFDAVLRKTSKMNEAELRKVYERFRKNEDQLH